MSEPTGEVNPISNIIKYNSEEDQLFNKKDRQVKFNWLVLLELGLKLL